MTFIELLDAHFREICVVLVIIALCGGFACRRG